MKSFSFEKKQWFFLSILLFLAAVGMEIEFDRIYSGYESNSFYTWFLLGCSLLAIYLIPFSLIYGHYRKKLDFSRDLSWFALVAGIFITGWLSVAGNDLLSKFWSAILPKAVFTEWESALTAPFAEELVKSGVAFLVLAFAQTWDKISVFMTGLMVGLGFQIMEDIAYIFDGAKESPSVALASSFSRVASSVASHYLYTAILTFALYYLFKKRGQVSSLRLTTWLVTPILSHFLWNSPFDFIVLRSLIVMASLLVFLDIFFYISKENHEKIEKIL